MVVYTFDPRTREAEAGGSPEFKASLVYIISFRTSRTLQRDPVSKKNKQKTKLD